MKSVEFCEHCKRPFRRYIEGQRYCSEACIEAITLKKRAASVKRTNIVPSRHKGSWGELIACAWLMEKGHEVFRNVSAHGPIDIIAIKGQETLYIDVKIVSLEMLTSEKNMGAGRARGGVLSPTQGKAGICALYVSPDGFCSFDRRDLDTLYSAIYKAHLTEAPETDTR